MEINKMNVVGCALMKTAASEQPIAYATQANGMWCWKCASVDDSDLFVTHEHDDGCEPTEQELQTVGSVSYSN